MPFSLPLSTEEGRGGGSDKEGTRKTQCCIARSDPACTQTPHAPTVGTIPADVPGWYRRRGRHFRVERLKPRTPGATPPSRSVYINKGVPVSVQNTKALSRQDSKGAIGGFMTLNGLRHEGIRALERVLIEGTTGQKLEAVRLLLRLRVLSGYSLSVLLRNSSSSSPTRTSAPGENSPS